MGNIIHRWVKKSNQVNFLPTPFPSADQLQLQSSFLAVQQESAAINHQDERVFTDLYSKFYPAVYHFALQFLEAADAEDITADVFSKLWIRRPCFTHLYQIKSFLQVSARNACFNYISHQGVAKRKETILAKTVLWAEGPPDYHEHASQRLLQLILDEIEKLPQKRRQVVKLFYLQGLKEKEIARRLKLGVGTVHNQKLRAVKSIRMAVSHLKNIAWQGSVFH